MSEKMVKITITIEKGLEKKLRLIQAKLIKESVASVSFSKATNYVISQGIRNLKLEIKAD